MQRSIELFAGAVLCATIALLPAAAHAAKNKPMAPAAKQQVAAPAATKAGLPEPPAGGLAERLAWADKQADALRTIVANAPKDEQARTLLAALALVVAGDLERALSAGDVDTAAGLRTLVEKKLHDTRWRLGVMGRDGNGGAYFALGVLALHGILGPKDEAIACQLFSSAWDKGFLDSAFRLSNCVAGKDPVRAAALLQSASDSGHATASELLGRRCLEAKPADLKCAASLIPAAADAGRPTAKSLLGWMYLQGIGVPADPARGLALYLEAAKGGALSAKNNLGELHETGRGVPQDAGKAFEYYREAAEAGFAPAQFNVGRLYAAGAGTPKDVDKARTWLNAALQAGIQPARKILDWLDTQPAEPEKR